MTLMTGWTDEQLMAIPHIGKAELINGKIITAPNGYEHSDIAGFLTAPGLIPGFSLPLAQLFESPDFDQ